MDVYFQDGTTENIMTQAGGEGVGSIQFLGFCFKPGKHVTELIVRESYSGDFLENRDVFGVDDLMYYKSDQLADLSVESISVVNGQLTFVMKNMGVSPVGRFAKGYTYVYVDDMATPTSILPWLDLDNNDFLKAGSSTVYTVGPIEGSHKVKVCVDYLNLVEESDEISNCETVQIQ